MRFLFTLVIVVGLTGCGCADVGMEQVSPMEQTLKVSQSTTLQYQTGGACRTGDHFTDISLHTASTVWHTSDTLIVVLDTLTGRVTGRAPGDAHVIAGGTVATIHVR
jgi:hypothetical protein